RKHLAPAQKKESLRCQWLRLRRRALPRHPCPPPRRARPSHRQRSTPNDSPPAERFTWPITAAPATHCPMPRRAASLVQRTTISARWQRNASPTLRTRGARRTPPSTFMRASSRRQPILRRAQLMAAIPCPLTHICRRMNSTRWCTIWCIKNSVLAWWRRRPIIGVRLPALVSLRTNRDLFSVDLILLRFVTRY